jgi:methionine-rich copper-binding protein CopC
MKRISSALLVTGVVAASLLVATPAFAHDELIDSTPAAGATLTELPDTFSITMNEDLLDLDDKGSGFGILIQDSEGLYYGDGCVRVDGPTMSADAVLGEPGEYTFIWQVVSSDGHPTSDEFTFTWAPDTDFAFEDGSVQPGDCNGQYVRDEVAAPEIDPVPIVAVGGVLVLLALAIVVFVLRRKKQD